MNEIEINLKDVNPIDFFGDQNLNFEIIKNLFPKLKIVARGEKIKVFGEKSQLKEFNITFNELISHFNRYNSINDYQIKNIVKNKGNSNLPLFPDELDILHGVGGKIIKAKSTNQIKIVELSKKNDLVFALGPAGTGKTYTSVAVAVKALKEKQVKRIILTRPAVEAGENLGFLPGDMKEKLDPYMQPLYDALIDMIPSSKLKTQMESGIIQIAPLAYMRGRTLDNAFVILDEAQNTTHAQMKMFLTRMGKNAKFIITGDPGQVDLPRQTISGLQDAVKLLKNIEGITVLYLNDSDVIRHELVKKVINAYKKIEKKV